MAIAPHRLARRVTFLLRQRERLRSQAAAFVLRYYREHRRLPAGYVTALLPNSTVRRIRLRAEIEHVFGISRIFIKLEDIFSTKKDAKSMLVMILTKVISAYIKSKNMHQ